MMEGPLNKTSSISFRLTNHIKNYAEFTAYFTADSDSCFEVSPVKGVLEPLGRQGSVFIVSYSPVEYGKPKRGKLVIQTDEMF